MTDMEDNNENRSGDTPLIQPKKADFLGGLRSSFLAGIVVAAPIGITIALVYWFVTGPMAKLDAFVKDTLPDGGSVVEQFLQVLPGFGVLIAFVALVILGALTKNFIGRSFIRVGEQFVEAVPVVRTLYRFFKNVFETALQQSDRSFKEVALIEYPRDGAWVMAFVVGSAKGEIKDVLKDQGDGLTALFVPTVPNPTSGFLLFLPQKDIRILDMSVEDAAKVVFSLGLVVPEFATPEEAVRKLEEIADTALTEPPKKRFFGIGQR
ncbi:MAG: membrane protein [Hyphococcus sp.]|nr:MAG: membrane protein [Marinicaulis sp.]